MLPGQIAKDILKVKKVQTKTTTVVKLLVHHQLYGASK